MTEKVENTKVLFFFLLKENDKLIGMVRTNLGKRAFTHLRT